MANLKELRAQAKELNITGAWDMNKAKLEKAISKLNMKPKTNAAGNQPWKRKLYYIDTAMVKVHADALIKAPRQVREIIDAMVKSEYTDADNTRDGTSIVDRAKELGLQSKIASANLFAYYRKKMENLGLVFAGYATESDE